ncbi:hypothetical protein [Croceicoccus marinus]|uniref:Uncharacterized protein n=1 Tax=Croceicoccus marinus TaxID=450378 RepID=A0A7G6W1D1_9SPHN|nr:hypothetical protein [Croceicoccus marinus]QNE07796.1 hypothetical protein H4O24_19830 [Croceicoccus marinus]
MGLIEALCIVGGIVGAIIGRWAHELLFGAFGKPNSSKLESPPIGMLLALTHSYRGLAVVVFFTSGILAAAISIASVATTNTPVG